MLTDKIVTPLARIALFSGLTPPQIEEIGRHTERMKFLNGEVIVKAGAPGDGAVLIISGTAERVEGPDLKRRSEPVEAGSLIGEMAMLIEHCYGSTVVACGRVLCLKVTRAALHAQMFKDTALVEHFERRITERLMKVTADLRQMDTVFAAAEVSATPHAGALPPPPAGNRPVPSWGAR